MFESFRIHLLQPIVRVLQRDVLPSEIVKFRYKRLWWRLWQKVMLDKLVWEKLTTLKYSKSLFFTNQFLVSYRGWLALTKKVWNWIVSSLTDEEPQFSPCYGAEFLVISFSFSSEEGSVSASRMKRCLRVKFT